jgi:protein O-mannosyl-transferase
MSGRAKQRCSGPAGEPPATASNSFWTSSGVIAVALALMTLAIYWPVLSCGFVDYDDQDYVTANAWVQGGLTWPGIKWAFTNIEAAFWHPLTWLSLMLDCQIYGLNATGFHLTSLAFHIANVLVLFGLLKQMTRFVWGSALVSAFFAWHPLHVESVAWVAQRKDVVSTLFFLLTLWTYAQYVKKAGLEARVTAGDSARVHLQFLNSGFYWLAFFNFALGLMSKSMLVTVPFVLLLLDYWPLKRFETGRQFRTWIGEPFARLVTEKLPFFALSIAASAITFHGEKKLGALSLLNDVPFRFRLASAAISYFGYVRKMFWPNDLAVLYPHFASYPVWQVAGAVLFILTISAATLRMGRSKPHGLVGWLWYLGMLVPVIGLIQVGYHRMADRYTYIPLIGLFIIVVWSADAARHSWPKLTRLLGTVGLSSLILCAGQTHVQLGFWTNSETLFLRALTVTRENYVMHNNLGNVLATQGRWAAAVEQYKLALQIRPDLHDAQYNLGVILGRLGRREEAIHHLREALKLRPNDPETQGELNRLSKTGQ